jgi:hypothetical protein
MQRALKLIVLNEWGRRVYIAKMRIFLAISFYVFSIDYFGLIFFTTRP